MRHILLFLAFCACSPQSQEQRSITLAAYTTPRDAYDQEIIPAFITHWMALTGEQITVETSYQGSGGQSRAIAGGFEADIAALSLEPDIERIVKAGLIIHDWRADKWGGMVTSSVAVPAFRPGNPKNIQDWSDLTREDVEVLTPNPRTSGGAMWNIATLYGASMRGFTSAEPGSKASATQFVGQVLKRVRIMDKGARESVLTFEQGVGDVAITYENEVITAKLAGKAYDYTIPKSSIKIVNPIAVIDVSVDKHGNRDIAEAFVKYLRTPDIQKIFLQYGYRPVIEGVSTDLTDPDDLFTVEDLGGWDQVVPELFGQAGVFDRAMELRGQ